MPARPRPILAVRLIGPAAVVTVQSTALVAHLNATYGKEATCRTSPPRQPRPGEIHIYITFTAKEAPPR